MQQTQQAHDSSALSWDIQEEFSLYVLTLEDDTDTLSRKVLKELPLYPE
jgi:hypothetical protein